MSADEVQRLLDEVFDQAIVYHGFTDYMRDYEIYVYCTADPSTGIEPETVRLLFKHCVAATFSTAVSPETWSQSLDDRLTDYEPGVDLDGYVWGVKWQVMYPGGTYVPDSATAAEWSESLGLKFHEVRIETNGHNMNLVFAELLSEVVQPGHAPFRVEAAGPDCKMPWGSSPD